MTATAFARAAAVASVAVATVTPAARASIVGADLCRSHGAAAPGRVAPGDSLVGSWTLDRGASGDVRRAIDTATARMNFMIRPIARSRLRNANELHARLTITITPTEIATQVDGATPISTPADGRPVTWTRENGDVFQVHTVLSGQRLTQIFVGRDASSRTNVFTPATDGRTLNVAVTVSHPRLPRSVVYTLVYRHDEATAPR